MKEHFPGINKGEAKKIERDAFLTDRLNFDDEIQKPLEGDGDPENEDTLDIGLGPEDFEEQVQRAHSIERKGIHELIRNQTANRHTLDALKEKYAPVYA